MARWINSYHFAREGRGVTGGCAGLQHVHLISSIENQAKNGGESLDGDLYITGGVIFKILEEPGTTGKVLRFPT